MLFKIQQKRILAKPVRHFLSGHGRLGNAKSRNLPTPRIQKDLATRFEDVKILESSKRLLFKIAECVFS